MNLGVGKQKFDMFRKLFGNCRFPVDVDTDSEGNVHCEFLSHYIENHSILVKE